MTPTWMTSVTLKMRSRSPSSNLVYVLPQCSCVPYLVRMSQIFPEILSGNHMPLYLMLSVTLKFRSRSPSSNFVFFLHWCFCVPNVVRTSKNKFLEILSRNHHAYHLSYVVTFNDFCDLENEVKVTRTWSSYYPGASVYQIW